MKNKKKVVVVIGIAAILLVSIIGYLMYQKRAAEQAAVEEQFNQIYAIGTDFSAAQLYRMRRRQHEITCRIESHS